MKKESVFNQLFLSTIGVPIIIAIPIVIDVLV